ncbi:MAG: peptide chain release factor 2 [Oligoflexia bacterium]|nr:peptide chain release factor 2 [Oligoflexia bacterium]
MFDVDSKRQRLKEVSDLAEKPEIWNNPKEMHKLQKEKAVLSKHLGEFDGLVQSVEDGLVLLDLAVEGQDEGSFEEVKETYLKAEKLADDLELKKMLSGPMDLNGSYLSINAGAGGTEACDWAGMLMRMYHRWGEAHGYRVELLDMTPGEGAGIKSCTLSFDGDYAFGYLKAENGVHRLVRISPFDSNARRHTSFASVFAYPQVEDDVEIEIKEADLKIDTYRSGGAGGQHVNKTESAVRITHVPTGVIVACQSERSQHANRDKAMKMLRARLYEKKIEEQNKERDKMNASKKAIEWGSQIRSYVMQPYQLVKDHRTDFETGNVGAVMDGGLDDFIVSYLKSQGDV